jgi:cyclopropane-fatty-acyl-phospholipid synthase
MNQKAMTNKQLAETSRKRFAPFPWSIELYDSQGNCTLLGQQQPHWYPENLQIHLHSQAAVKDFLNLNAYRLVERYLQGEVDLEGNFHILSSIKAYVPVTLSFWQLVRSYLRNHYFQTIDRARDSVKSHYDIPQSLLERYLDTRYMAYSCAMFEDAELRADCLPDLRKAGQGESDRFDSLEKAQWRKFKDAVDFIAPAPGETLLDVGCGYGGQLEVALQNYPFGKVVGWTHSRNQVTEGSKLLAAFPRERWELNEGDYREDERRYDHITSTGMISHVGPRGLEPYVRNIRRRIRTGGRYLHHALMANYSSMPLDRQVGIAFNKRYVWPGFHWFTLAEHMRVLEQNGFKLMRMQNLRAQYSKTITAWYERFMLHQDVMRAEMGEPTFRAWRLYLGGGAGIHSGDVNRLYCVAV